MARDGGAFGCSEERRVDTRRRLVRQGGRIASRRRRPTHVLARPATRYAHVDQQLQHLFDTNRLILHPLWQRLDHPSQLHLLLEREELDPSLLLERSEEVRE